MAKEEEVAGYGIEEGAVPQWLKVVIMVILLWMAYYLATNLSP